MTTTPQKPRLGIMFLALVFLLYGFLITAFGFVTLGEWSAIDLALAGCGIIWALSGSAMAFAALWLLGSLGRSLQALRIGGIGAALAGFVLLSSALTHVLPCSGAG
jgi:hypothetical protein